MKQIAFVTLGCPKNQVDSEVMLGRLDRAGYALIGDLAQADAAVVNTCAFLESAVSESIETILDVARYKTEGRLKTLIVAGCLSDRYRGQLMDELPEVDAVMGTGDVGRIVEIVNGLIAPEKGFLSTADDVDAVYGDPTARVLSTSPVSPYLKISEGCDAKCTFCIIPQLRGGQRSRSIPNIVAEAEALVANGAREAILIAQDLTAFGMDQANGVPQLAPLLRALDGVEGLRWARLMYANPFYWTEELIETVATSRVVVPYADMPIQHITDRMLKRMGRHTNRATVEQLVQDLRARVPGISLRTNIIVGFPGETDADFEELMEFLRDARFDKLVAFSFSPEDTAPATRLGDPVDPEVTQERLERLLAQQGEISLQINRSQVGRTLEVLIEEAPSGSGAPAKGRSSREAPEVDGCVRVAGTDLVPGRFYPVAITGADAYDLVGVAAQVSRPVEIIE